MENDPYLYFEVFDRKKRWLGAGYLKRDNKGIYRTRQTPYAIRYPGREFTRRPSVWLTNKRPIQLYLWCRKRGFTIDFYRTSRHVRIL